ncbi:MAG: dihydroorotase [Thermoanaerobaculia bacterium]|nr:dihydroorotase [Thermoanaerobaculia bacterium]
MSSTLIRQATCVLPDGIGTADVLVADDKIVRVDAPVGTRADHVVDARGLHLLPGVVDDQVHFREPGLEHKEDLHTGSLACAKGGVTTYLEMPNTQPATTSVEALHAKLALARSKSVVNYGFFVGATGDNLAELRKARRTPGIKIFIGSSTGDLLVDDQTALERIFAETRLPICAHCEDEATVRANRARLESQGPLVLADHSRIRDHEAARISTARALDLAERHDHRFHVLHVSTRQEVRMLSALRGRQRQRITAEACPHHLFFSVDDYERLGSRVQMNPSVKTARDVEALWEGLQEGALQVIATDHAPHTLQEKASPYPGSPSGVPAVENSLPLLLDQVNRGRCTLAQVVHWMCDAPARVWDIVGKGRIVEGWDADLVLVDLQKEATVLDDEQATKSRWSPWHGTTLRGWPVRTWVMGRTVFKDGVWNAGERGREVLFDHRLGGYWATRG